MTLVDPERNRLLASLPPATLQSLLAHAEWVEMPLGAMFYQRGAALAEVHFPMTSIVSLVSPMQNGDLVEVATVGNEGVAGVCAFMGGGPSLSAAMVQSAGWGLRVGARAINEAAERSAPLMASLLRYAQSLFSQMAQTSACYRHHQLDQQLSRWLLMNHDRTEGDELRATHEQIACMLGVRREGVTSGAMKLQDAGLIRYTRGRISIVDRSGLEASSCECYAVVRQSSADLRLAEAGRLTAALRRRAVRRSA